MSAKRAAQVEIVAADFQQSIDAFADGRCDIAIKHGRDGVQKLIEFRNAENGADSTASQLTIDIDPKSNE